MVKRVFKLFFFRFYLVRSSDKYPDLYRNYEPLKLSHLSEYKLNRLKVNYEFCNDGGFAQIALIKWKLDNKDHSSYIWNMEYGILDNLLHPEVTLVGLLTLLYAGTTFNYSFKYSPKVLHNKTLIDIVKKLKQRSKSAGNNIIYSTSDTLLTTCNVGTSETLRDETILNTEIVKSISVHVPTHLKPINDTQLGHYLAGLIDGDGHFSSKQQLVIAFSSSDSSLAHYLKKEIGYGSVRKVKNKNAVILVVAATKGIEKIINMINGKLRTDKKLDQIKKNILGHIKFKNYSNVVDPNLNNSDDLCNLWLAGFSDADSSFQIKLISRNNHTEIRLNFQVDQKEKDLLVLIKNSLGGNIGYRGIQDTYYYGSTSFGSARKAINYFDKYHLLSTKYINYIKWRKAYIIIQDKDHLTINGIDKIAKIKNTMNRLNTHKIDMV